MITDEMVEKAKTTFTRCAEKQAEWDIAVRAALEAVAPMLIAQGMREALDCCLDPTPIVSSGEMVRTYRRDGKEIEEAILARSAALSQECIQTWDTMDTAPRDGGWIIGLTTHNKVEACQWIMDDGLDEEHGSNEWGRPGGLRLKLKGWMPLPKAPTP